jgi:hypothetical protein
VYPVIADPPLNPGVHDTGTWPFLKEVPTTAVGASGTVAGFADTEEEAGPVPELLAMVTLKVYEVPFVSPDTRQLPISATSVAVEQVAPPGVAVTV